MGEFVDHCNSLESYSDTVILTTKFFTVKSPVRPHIPACDGGHLFIEVNDSTIEDRTQLTPEAAIECMWLTMVIGQAFADVMRDQGQDLYRINYQDNGNWSFLRGERPRLHIHLYGRSKTEQFQTYGQALYFPDPSDARYNDFEPIDKTVLYRIGMHAFELALDPKYQWHRPARFILGNTK